MKAYIAAPFFNDDQVKIVEDIKDCLDNAMVEYFSPKDESMFKQGDDPKDILTLNCDAIRKQCSAIIVVTDGKDVGTIWEAGYAYAHGIPIIYVWLGYQPHMKFNIMLAASGKAVVHSIEDLQEQMEYFLETRSFLTSDSEMLHE